jgi:hypothetical protein
MQKIKQYDGDVVKYFNDEWGSSDKGPQVRPEPSLDDMVEYEKTETQFMKQFFSIKA